MDSHLILSKINSIEAKLVQLEDEVKTATGESKHDLNQRITATQNSLTELYKHLPLPTPASGAHIPLVTSTVQSSSAVVHEVPITVVANGRTIHLLFVLDGGCEVDLVISDEAASLLGFDDLDDDQFENGDAGVTGGGVALFRIYRGIVEVNFTTGRGSTRKTNCANVYVGGPDNLMGLPTQGRLRVGVADTSGTISIFPVRPARIV